MCKRSVARGYHRHTTMDVIKTILCMVTPRWIHIVKYAFKLSQTYMKTMFLRCHRCVFFVCIDTTKETAFPINMTDNLEELKNVDY